MKPTAVNLTIDLIEATRAATLLHAREKSDANDLAQQIAWEKVYRLRREIIDLPPRERVEECEMCERLAWVPDLVVKPQGRLCPRCVLADDAVTRAFASKEAS